MKQIYIYGVIVLLCAFHTAKAQCISGSLNICVNSSAQYTYTGPSTRINWEVVSGGYITGNPRAQTVTVVWEQGGAHQLMVEDLDGNNNTCTGTINVRGAIGGSVTVESVDCETGSATFSLTGPPGDWGTVVGWESSTDAENWSPIANTSTSYAVTGLTSSTYFRAVVEDCGITTPSSSGFVELVPGGTVSLVAGSPQFCVGESATVTLRIDNYSGTLKAWQKSEYSNGVWGSWETAVPNPPDEYQFFVQTPTRFRGRVLTDVCGFLPSQNFIEIAGNPITTVAGEVQSTSSSVCPGEQFSIAVTGNVGSVEQWYIKGPMHEQWGNLASTSNITITGATSFKALVRNGSCGAKETDPITVVLKPAPEIDNNAAVSICSGAQINYTPASSLANTNYLWTASFSPAIAGVPANGNGVPLNHTITNTSNTVQQVIYTITPEKDGCMGAAKSYVATIKPVPDVSITPNNVKMFSGQSINALISNPNQVAGTNFSWTIISAGNISGAAPGNGNAIVQTLTCTDNTQQASATYRVTPEAAGCVGIPANVSVQLFPIPEVVFNGPEYLSYSGGATALKVRQSYSGYQWFKENTSIASTQTVNIDVPGNYHVRVAGTPTGPFYNAAPINIGETISAQNQNYIRTIVFQKEGITENTNYFQLDPSAIDHSVQYFDELGRPLQDVSIKGSPSGEDIVHPVAYDLYGREAFKYLPYVAGLNDGRYQPEAISNQLSFYNNGESDNIKDDASPYSVTRYESSPLNRVMKAGAPGTAWQPDTDVLSTNDHAVKKRYETNDNDDVLLFSYDPVTGAVKLHSGVIQRFFRQNQLFANKTYDENNNEVIEYTDKEGRMVCKKVQYGVAPNSTKLYAATYYIYDDFGNLAVVLPPEAVTKMEALTNQN